MGAGCCKLAPNPDTKALSGGLRVSEFKKPKWKSEQPMSIEQVQVSAHAGAEWVDSAGFPRLPRLSLGTSNLPRSPCGRSSGIQSHTTEEIEVRLVHHIAGTPGYKERPSWATAPLSPAPPVIWDALRAAAEADLCTAKLILQSAGIVVAAPDMTTYYDERGECTGLLPPEDPVAL